MLIMINNDNKKRGKAWKFGEIKKIVLDLHGVIVNSRMVFLFEYE